MDLRTGVILVPLICFGVVDWRRAVYCSALVAIFEGALRKWFFPASQEGIFFAKDALVAGACLGYLFVQSRAASRRLPAHPATAPLVLLAALAAAELANPYLPSPLVGLYGLKAYLSYVPLMYLVPAAVGDVAGLRRLLLPFFVLALVPLLLGPIQFWSPPDSVLNQYVAVGGQAPDVAGFAGSAHVRVTGTFSYITGHTTFLLLLVLLALPLAIVERRPWVRAALLAELVLAAANILMSGSRGPLLLVSVAACALLLLPLGGRPFARIRALAALAVALGVAAALTLWAFPAAGEVFATRAAESDDVPQRVVGVFVQPVWALSQAGPFGFGVGSANQAAPLILGSTGASLPPAAEGEPERIILELGPLGLLLVLAARLLVLGRHLAALGDARATPLWPVVAGAFLFALVHLPGNLVFNHTASFFYWFTAGFALVPARSAAASSRPRPEAGERALASRQRRWAPRPRLGDAISARFDARSAPRPDPATPLRHLDAPGGLVR